MSTITTKPLTRAKIRANRKKWLAALRSGKYKQTRNTLKEETPTGPKYCSLGVAVEVCGFIGLYGKALQSRDLYALGLSTEQESHCVAMNDEEHKRFKTIANAIEAMPIIYPKGVK